MGSEIEMERGDTSERKNHKHRGKFTEGLLDSKLILKALNIKTGQTILDAGCVSGYVVDYVRIRDVVDYVDKIIQVFVHN